jgi:hypothetical protein
MPAGFRLHPLSSDSSATGQISARQVDAACHVAQLYVAFAKVKQLVADFRANEKFYLSPAYRCDGPLREGETFLRRPSRGTALRDQIDALVYDLYALTPAEIQIVEGTAT